MAKLPSPYRFTYHQRRVLGTIVYAEIGIPLDNVDTRHAERLLETKYVTSQQIGENLIYSATELGKTTWYGWLKPKV